MITIGNDNKLYRNLFVVRVFFFCFAWNMGKEVGSDLRFLLFFLAHILTKKSVIIRMCTTYYKNTFPKSE